MQAIRGGDESGPSGHPPVGALCSESARQRPPVPQAAWRNLVIMLTLYLLSYLDRQLMSLVLPAVQHDLALSDVQLGEASGVAVSIFYSTVGLALGWGVDRLPIRRLLFAGVVVWSIATVFCGLARNFESLFAARIGVGFGEAVVGPAAFAVLSGSFPPRRLSSVMGIYASAASIGAGFMFVFGGMLISSINARGGIVLPVVGHLAAWQAAFAMVGALGIPIASIAFFISDPLRLDRAAAAGRGDVSIGRFLRSNRTILSIHIAAVALLTMSTYGVIVWTPTFLSRTFHWSPVVVGTVVGLSNGIAGVSGNIFWGAVSDRVATRRGAAGVYQVYSLTVLAGVPFIVAAFLSRNPALTVIGLSMTWAIMFSYGGVVGALGHFVPLHLRGRISALSGLAGTFMGIGVAPALVGAITEHVLHSRAEVGLSVLIVSTASASVASLLLWMGRRPLQRAAEAFNPRVPA